MDLRMLGPVEVVDSAGKAVKLPGARPRALLALLAVRAPQVVPADVIIEAVWGSEVAKPEASLHMAVNRLRSAVGDEVIVTEPGGYRLELPASNTDVARFRALVQRSKQLHTLGHPSRACETYRHALSQWRGPALADLQEFEFAQHNARLLEEERIGAVEQLMDAMLAAGEHDLVVGELFGLVEAFPYRERLWELLMLALYRSGRQADALAAFKNLRTRLGEDLGVEPSPELMDLEERILLHDPALADYLPAPADLGEDVEYQTFSPGALIVEQGDAAGAIYWIEEGRVEILKSDDDGRYQRLAELGPGHYFGELAATLGTRRTASVRAMVPTTVSIHDLQSLRSRLGAERGRAGAPADAAEELWDLIRRGQSLQAFDTAARYIEAGDSDPEVRYLAVLALLRAGATSQARRRYAQYGLDTIDLSSIPPKLAGDIAVLAPRLDKDEALARRSLPEGSAWAERAATGYAAAHERLESPYHAVNAATMWLLAGNQDVARALAEAALGSNELQGHGYWDAVTEAEAALIVDDVDRATHALEIAAESGGGQLSQRATTLKQLKLVCDLKGVDRAVLAPIRNPAVVHFCGHRILSAGEHGRFPADEEPRVRAKLDETFEALDAGTGFGSLAAGADILAAEALLERGAELHVVLPFDRDEFVRTSVVSAGGDWVERFERCLASATSVEIVSSGEYLDDPVMFDFCARIAMGDALIRARMLETNAHQVAVWDGTPSYGVAGTAVDVRTWGATGAPATVISVNRGDSVPGADTDQRDRRHIRAIVFADFAGFSKLSDAQLVAFQGHVMKEMAHRLEPYRPELLSGRTWGDGIYLVFSDVAGAAECALDLVSAVSEFDMAGAGLPELRGLRVAAHAAPVFEGWDPIAGNHLFYGVGVTQAARIEPRTPEGEIYTTHAFAALAMLSNASTFECQYVGTLPTAKNYGDLPLYALRRRA
ncbi:MAG: cyclic nucleotide-binding domain-containing protein [Acidimicrobiia bacterium]|nr:cyclic nucleotide-binding domain-containing protein [Acidimicrobiia bacterium]